MNWKRNVNESAFSSFLKICDEIIEKLCIIAGYIEIAILLSWNVCETKFSIYQYFKNSNSTYEYADQIKLFLKLTQ